MTPETWPLRQDSNLYLPLRRGLFYPLNYREKGRIMSANETLLRLPQVLRAVGIGRTAWLDRVRDRVAPQPIKIGRATVWRSVDIQAWIEEKTQARQNEKAMLAPAQVINTSKQEAIMLNYEGMQITVEFVTPAIAKKWMEQNTGNRRLRETTVEQYARDMLAGNWESEPVPVCFDETGKLGNGQHRLSAIIKSGKAQKMLVARHVPRRAIAMMDRGLGRTLNDVSKFVGANFDSRQASIARILKWGPRDQGAKSFDELFEAYQEHADVIDLVCASASKTAGMNAAMLAVCAKAAYKHDHAKIQRFLHILRTGMIEGEHESAAIRLRDFARSLRGASTLALREETYNKTMSALQNFLERKPMSKLYGTQSDLFPVPRTAS